MLQSSPSYAVLIERTSTYWLNEVALLSGALTTGDHRCALLFTRLHVAHDPVALRLRDLRSLVRVGLEWVSDLERLGLLLEASSEFVVDALLDVDSGSGTTCLSVVEAGISICGRATER
jgi:hypothetical protein